MRAARGLCDWPFNQAALDGPQPPGLDEPLLTAPESPVHTLRWCLREAHWRLSKEGRWAWEDKRTGELRPDRGVEARQVGVHPGGQKSRPSEGSVYDAAHVPGQLLGMRDGGEGGGKEILVLCPHVGTLWGWGGL